MIQRIQSIYFLGAALLCVLGWYLPFGVKDTTSIGTYAVNTHVLSAKGNLLLSILYGTLAGINFFAIFLFGNRSLQKTLALISMLLSIGILAWILYDSSSHGNKLVFGFLESRFYLGILLPPLIFLCSLLAWRGIRSDEKLLQQTERLR